MWGWLSGSSQPEVPNYPEIPTPKETAGTVYQSCVFILCAVHACSQICALHSEFLAVTAKARSTLLLYAQEPGWTDVAFDRTLKLVYSH
jgi:hypothetical protein